MADAAIAAPTASPESAQAKYRAERERRLRADGAETHPGQEVAA